MKRILITGTAGFIGFHLSKLLLDKGYHVHGFDGLTDYYEVSLKRKRHEILEQYESFSSTVGMLENERILTEAADSFSPHMIIHLAAQAGVRYSLENPMSYLNSNVIGGFNIMEVAKNLAVDHLLMASTSSVYGSNKVMPFVETEKADDQITIYAATKKANESMAHAYAHLWDLPITMFRFFTVYGPWGRPDLALFKFVKAILKDEAIDIYNHGNMFRDFTYVDDLVLAIYHLLDCKPPNVAERQEPCVNDSLSDSAPFRIVNIGNSEKVKLLDFIEAIEMELGKTAKRNYMDMQVGDVPATWANTELLFQLTGFRPSTNYKEGVRNFVNWFKEYYGEQLPD